MSPLKLELAHRISESLAGGKTLTDAAKASRHVLAVLEEEARRTGSLRWLDGGAWKIERYPATLSRSVGESMRKPTKNRPPGVSVADIMSTEVPS